jgi:type IV secretion system protein VirD4
MEKIRKGFSYLAGFHIHLMPIIQNVGEFYALYGKDESDTFFQNTEYKIMYRQNTETDKTFVSRTLGDKTVKLKTKTRHQSGNNAGTTSGENLIKLPLLSPNEIARLPKSEAILQIGGEPPVKFDRLIFYKEDLFKSRLLPPVEIPMIAPLYPDRSKMLKAQSTPEETSQKTDTDNEPSTEEVDELYAAHQSMEE